MNILRKLTFTAIAILALTASAFAQGHEGSCICGKISGTRATWQIEHTDPRLQQAAAAEMDRWNKYANLIQYGLGDGVVGPNNGQNEIVFLTAANANSIWGLDLDSDTFGYTPSSPQSAFGTPGFNQCPIPPGTACGNFTESDVIINADFSRGWTTTGPPDFDDDHGPALYGATAVHELGHSLGFHHNFKNLSTMNYYEDYAAQYISSADAATLRAAYPSQAQSVTDMAVYPFVIDANKQQYDMTAPVAFSPANVTAGGKLTIANITIENVGSADLSNVQYRFYLSSDANITTADTLLGGYQYTLFPSGAFDDDGGQGVQLDIPASVASGSYYVGALVTYNTSSVDTVTYNNTWVAPGKVTIGTVVTNPCAAADKQLFLNNNRFQINASWKDFQGNTGCGTPVKLTSDTGYFWFFANTNVELVVKALDGRPVNGKWWIFYGALSNVEYTMTVTDTVSGITKQYKNASGNFASVGDTNAF